MHIVSVSNGQCAAVETYRERFVRSILQQQNPVCAINIIVNYNTYIRVFIYTNVSYNKVKICNRTQTHAERIHIQGTAVEQTAKLQTLRWQKYCQRANAQHKQELS